MIIIINGPLGIGKTDVSWQLLPGFERGIMLDGDYIGAVHPFEIYDEARVEHLYQTIRHLISFHKSHNYHNFIINYVFETPQSLARLRHLLADLDDVIYAFRLCCDEFEHEQRVLSRKRKHITWELTRFKELITIIEAASNRGDMGYPIDTTPLTIPQVADLIWAHIKEAVELVPYNPAWPQQYQTESQKIQTALADYLLEIHHIGSTAIPGLTAKPIIDIMLTVKNLEDAVECIAPLKQLGYFFLDYPQNTDRRFFKKGFPRTHHLHIVEQNSQSLREHLLFRDALRNSEPLCQEYAAIKTGLATRYKNDRATYSASKTAFINKIINIS